MRKKLLGIFFALVLCALILPAAAFADGTTPNYLTFTSTGSSTLQLKVSSANSLKYQKKSSGQEWADPGVEANWTDCTTSKDTGEISLNNGDQIRFKGQNVKTDEDNHFIMTGSYGASGGNLTGSIAASGDVTSLTNGSGGDVALTESCYCSMFYRCNELTTAPNLPSTTLAGSCYENMFYGCNSLTIAPKLPATTLAEICYNSMFSGCMSLATAPALPATTLANSCYYCMFSRCTSLATAPALPATTLAESCYNSMFSGCTSLATAPALPAETLAGHCYNSMFSGCTSLTTAPELLATTLAESCYSGMFVMCKSLTTAPALPATTLAESCYSGMFTMCESLTTAPELPATTLAEYSYTTMFYGCTLLEAPAMMDQVTTLGNSCCNRMYYGCTSLKIYTEPQTETGYTRKWKATSAPETSGWAADMFTGCGASVNVETGKTYYIKHQHSWNYTLSEDKKTVRAACVGSGTCTYTGTDKSLTIQAPANLTYDGSSHEASFTTTSFLGSTTLPTISYEYKATENGTYTSTTDTKAAGYYKASFTVGDKKAFVEYTIVEAEISPNTGLTSQFSALPAAGILIGLAALIGLGWILYKKMHNA